MASLSMVALAAAAMTTQSSAHVADVAPFHAGAGVARPGADGGHKFNLARLLEGEEGECGVGFCNLWLTTESMCPLTLHVLI